MRTCRFSSAAVVMLAALAFAPLAQAQAGAPPKFFFEGDLVRGPGPGGPTCVLSNQFKHSERVVWRVRVLDPAGQSLDDKALKSLVVEMSDGQKFPMRFGGHPLKKDTDHFWSASWAIPETYPTGSFTYKVTATDAQGQSASWEPFNVAPSQLTVVEGSVPPAK
jgi:hypothetical protein